MFCRKPNHQLEVKDTSAFTSMSKVVVSGEVDCMLQVTDSSGAVIGRRNLDGSIVRDPSSKLALLGR